jgi:hypothetical protein
MNPSFYIGCDPERITLNGGGHRWNMRVIGVVDGTIVTTYGKEERVAPLVSLYLALNRSMLPKAQ